MTTLISLVGGQPLPNLLPIRYYEPDHTVLVFTATTKEIYARLHEAIQPIHTTPVECDPYQIQSITEKLYGVTREFDPTQLLFNLTGGTKAMAIAGYSVAAKLNARFLYLESEKRQSRVYHYQFQAGIPRSILNEPLPSCISIGDFLNVHFGKEGWSEEGYSRSEGGPFEQAIGTALAGQFDVKAGIKAHNGQIDIDLVVGTNNQFGIIQAKSGTSSAKLDGIKQLSTNARFLGTYTRQFYVIDQSPNEAHDAIVSASQIKVIPLTSYRDSGRLSDADQQKLVEQVRRELVGEM